MEQRNGLEEAILLQWNRELLEQGLISEQLYRRAEIRIVEEYHKKSGRVANHDKNRRALSGTTEGKL